MSHPTPRDALLEITIREATPGDSLAIATVHVRSWQEAYRDIMPSSFLQSLSVARRQEQWRQRLLAGHADTWVADAAGEVLGWLGAGPSRDSDALPSTRELWAINIDPAHWRRGVGRRLLADMEARLTRAGAVDVTLWVLQQNVRALAFYRSCGFGADSGAAAEQTIEIGGHALPEVRLRKVLAR